MDEPTCSTEDCKKLAKARGMCGACWKRWRDGLKRAGLPRPPLEPKPKLICKVQGCDEDAGRRSGYCFDHYQRNWKTGDPLTLDRRTTRALPAGERLWLKVDKDGPLPEQRPELGPCWVWTGAKQGSGYGHFVLRRQGVGAHVAAYVLTGEVIPEGMDLDHLCHPGDGSCPRATCRHRLCVNPSHLEPVTRLENLKRGNTFVAANVIKTHCPKGHEYTPENTRVRLAPSGNEMRSCKQCARDASAAARDARGGMSREAGWKSELAKKNETKTHCPQGHEYTPENTFFDKSSNGRRCRICMRAKSARSNEVRRQAKKRTNMVN